MAYSLPLTENDIEFLEYLSAQKKKLSKVKTMSREELQTQLDMLVQKEQNSKYYLESDNNVPKWVLKNRVNRIIIMQEIASR